MGIYDITVVANLLEHIAAFSFRSLTAALHPCGSHTMALSWCDELHPQYMYRGLRSAVNLAQVVLLDISCITGCLPALVRYLVMSCLAP